jgi:ribosome-binding protein aMBF1 (putative translation factor)
VEVIKLRCRLCGKLVEKLGPKWVKICKTHWPVCEDCAKLGEDDEETHSLRP